ncbi:MAG: DUF3311 domain-containing protein, partial [Rhodospirillales bacterium]|nr:DUF3311 domain-containing protein [Rhodospirillales bacterium]
RRSGRFGLAPCSALLPGETRDCPARSPVPQIPVLYAALQPSPARAAASGFDQPRTVLVMRFLAVLPFLGILVGTPFFNRVEPFVLGLPLILAWLLLWILLTSAIMAIVYRFDPANRREDGDA